MSFVEAFPKYFDTRGAFVVAPVVEDERVEPGNWFVETIGFEPTTPWLQTRCSTD
jgi:hypothetical protein